MTHSYTFDLTALGEARFPCFNIADQLTKAGFPLKLGLNAPEKWANEVWRWEQFRAAAKSIGADRWSFDVQCGEFAVFRWHIPDTLVTEKAPKPGVSLETAPFCDKQRLVRLMWAVRGQYCQFETGDVVKLSKHGDHARLERVEWRNSLTISNVLSIEDYLIAYEDAETIDRDHPLPLLLEKSP